MRQCEVCGRDQPRRDDLQSGDRCECPIVKTPGIISGQWRLAGTRLFARTLLAMWVESGRDKSATVDLFLRCYFHSNQDLTSERIHRAVDWLCTHHRRVGLEALEAKFDDLDETLVGAADYCQQFGIEREVFEEKARDAASSAWDIVKLGDLRKLGGKGGGCAQR